MADADLPSKEDNLSEDRMVREPTADEIKKAVRSVSSAFAVIRAVQKFVPSPRLRPPHLSLETKTDFRLLSPQVQAPHCLQTLLPRVLYRLLRLL